MKDYVSTLQSQIARNSVEIKHKEFIVRIAKANLKEVKDELSICKKALDESGIDYPEIYLIKQTHDVSNLRHHLEYSKKTLKKLVENQKMLKKLKTQLVLLDNLYGEEDW